MAKEKKRMDNSPDNSTVSGNAHLKDLSELMSVLNENYNHKKMDGFEMYLYAIILKKLDLTQLAVTVFLECVHLVPFLWGAWLELAPLIESEDQLQGLALPKHWIKPFFVGMFTIFELANISSHQKHHFRSRFNRNFRQ